MKRRIAILLLAAIMIGLLSGCCRHVWYAATCTAPKTCQECGETEGEALGHTWQDATCTVPKTWSVCKETEGEALGHQWEEATTEAPKTCTVCAATEGSKISTDPRFTTASTKEIQGKWECETVFTGEMLGTTGYLDEMKATLHYEFKNDGNFDAFVELEDQFAFLEALKKVSLDATYAATALEGYTKEQTDAAYQELYGMTVEQFVNEFVNSMDLEEFFAALSADGVYYMTENKIWVAASWLNEFEGSEYTLEGDTLVIDDDVLEEGGEPLQWKRVKE